MSPGSPIWYPKLRDVEDVYGRIAGIYEAPKPPEEDVLTTLIVAPQRAGVEEKRARPIAYKSAALLESAVTNKVFPQKNLVTTHALIQLFVDKNGFALQDLMNHLGKIAYRIEDGHLTAEEIAAWLAPRLRRQRKRRPERVFAALSTLASVIESLENHPSAEDPATRLDAAGSMICSLMVDVSRLNDADREHLLNSYPAVKDRWENAVWEEETEGSS